MPNDPKANDPRAQAQNPPPNANAPERLVSEKAAAEANVNPPQRKPDTPNPDDPRSPATIDAHGLVRALRAAVGSPTEDVAPPPSSETRPGGKFRIGSRLVDCDGMPLDPDELEKEEAEARAKATRK